MYGGAERVIHQLAKELGRHGATVEVLTAGAGPFTEQLAATGVPWSLVALPRALMVYGHQTTGLRSVKAALALPWMWARLVPWLWRRGGLVHVADLRGVLLLGPPSRMARLPVVWHVNFPDRSRLLNRIGAAFAQRIIVPSASARDALVGVPAQRVRVIPGCLTPEALEVPPASGRTPLLVTAARLAPEKGLDVLIEALPHVRAAVPQAQLLVQGSAQEGHEAYAQSLHRLIRRRGLESAVTFAGFAERPWDEWRDAAVYVQPSHQESFGLAVVEAMAAALPVVASDVGGMRDTVEHGVTGLLVPPGDVNALAAALIRLLQAPDEARRLGRAGRDRVAGSLTVSAVTDRFVDLYRELTG
ncbi:MAG: glycosyltransferase family 4 protein [Acidimicrobiales bacterium]